MCAGCGWEDVVEEIDEMLDCGCSYEFAEETLTGIKNWVYGNEHVTEDQLSAIENIKTSVE